MPQIIALSGSARSGKDTVADYLVKNYGYVKVSFADPMRKALYALNPNISVVGMGIVPLANAVDNVGWELLKSESPDVRPLMQRMGTEVGRAMFGQNVWVDRALSEAENYEKVVIADCRFPNEADAVKAYGGMVWRIERPGVAPANSHISETALDSYEFDLLIANSGTLENLWESVDSVLDK